MVERKAYRDNRELLTEMDAHHDRQHIGKKSDTSQNGEETMT
jgi:hypothetical protein